MFPLVILILNVSSVAVDHGGHRHHQQPGEPGVLTHLHRHSAGHARPSVKRDLHMFYGLLQPLGDGSRSRLSRGIVVENKRECVLTS